MEFFSGQSRVRLSRSFSFLKFFLRSSSLLSLAPHPAHPPSKDREGWWLEVGGWKMEVGGWRMEDGGWKLEDGGWRIVDEMVRRETNRFVLFVLSQQERPPRVIVLYVDPFLSTVLLVPLRVLTFFWNAYTRATSRLRICVHVSTYV